MRKKAYISLTGMLALLLPIAAQAGDKTFGGSIELTPTFADVDGNVAKFNRYRDIDSGLYGSLDIWAETGRFFLDLEASDILYDTQRYDVTGGTHGKYKFNLFYNEIPSNLSFDARTPLSGAGSGTLTYGGGTLNTVRPAVSTWNVFDYAIERRQGGGGLRVNMFKPFFFDVSFSQEDREGIKPHGTSWNAATGGGNRRILEMPEPVDYVTNTIHAEAGYSLNPIFASVSYAYSEFENDNDFLMYEHPFTANTMEAVSLAPDNEFYNFDFKGRAMLPLKSSLNLRAERGVAESSTLLRQQYLGEIGNVVPITLSDTVFDGKVTTTSYDVALTSNPVPFASGKVFYKYHEKDNESDKITTNDGGTIFSNHLFGYDKNTFGVNIDFKLPQHIGLKPSWQHVETDRHRGDFPETTDNIYGIEAQWDGLDWLVVKAGYELLNRDSTWAQLSSVVSVDQPNANLIEPYLRRFDLAPQDRDTYTLGFDIIPSDGLNVGLGYRYRNVDYSNPYVGLREEESRTYDFSMDYVLRTFKAGAYFAYEKMDYFQFQRRITAAASANPGLGLSGTNYNYSIAEQATNWDYGVSAEVELVPNKWRVKAQYDRVRSNGLADFTQYDGATIASGYTDDTLDHLNYDDYRKSSLLLKAIYTMNKNITATLGYAFERYKFNDAQLDGYLYNFNTNDFLTGVYSNPDFGANVFFCTVKYSF